MDWYKRHIGDYTRDTAHLTLLEHGAYNRLLDLYYAREGSLPDAQVERLACARTDDERAAVRAVLSEFFTLTDGVWVNKRADRELAAYHETVERGKRYGAMGGRPVKDRTLSTNNHEGYQTLSENNHEGYPTLSKNNHNQNQNQNQNQEVITTSSVASTEPPVLEFPCNGQGPKTWALTPAKVSEWQTAYPAVDVLTECRKARQWCIDNPRKAKTHQGMARFLGSWLSRQQDRGATPAAAPPPQAKAQRINPFTQQPIED